MPKYFVLLLVLLLSACTNIIRTTEESDQVHLYFLERPDDSSAIQGFERECVLIGEVVGSEGHWSTFLFTRNADMTQGALNDLKNKAHAMGANTVVVYKNLGFSSSVTFLGQGYNCTNSLTGKDSKARF